ncbi:MAG: ATP-binding protein [Methanomicrobium sp.]|nr:ATP-binding protein [Methanomicrobium sp.]
MTEYIQKPLFEENYLVRTLGQLVKRPDLALTELVANAWDAGASKVIITIPKNEGQLLVVEDDGTGLTPEEFRKRWMTLGYNRIAHQGKEVIFPPGREEKRKAYGKNGVGRHGMLCFNDEYTVITCSKGTKTIFTITTSNEEHPFIIKNERKEVSDKHGTRLEVSVARNLPKTDFIIDTISARFLHDPKFTITINGNTATLEKHPGIIKSVKLEINKNISLEIFLLESGIAHSKILYQGIAFWQDNRLVGDPSWILGKNQVIDGRTKFAKKYSVIIKTNDLSEYVKEDWSGFIKNSEMDHIYEKVAEQIHNWFFEISSEYVSDTRDKVYDEYSDKISNLSRQGKYEVDEFINHIAADTYTIPLNTQSKIFGAFINLESSRSGKELLQKLSVMAEEDIDDLNRLLEQWTVKDALSVLDEIDRRISVIEAIDKLSGDKDVDELHVLHPLVTEARWVFGPEFDSPEYTSNKGLRTAVQTIFKKNITSTSFENSRRRPDIVVLQNSTISITGTQIPNIDTQLQEINRILIIELKKGGFELTRDERNQALGYSEDFIGLNHIIGNPFVYAFVVGETIDQNLQPTQDIKNSNNVKVGTVTVTTYSQLIDTASKRLFKLREYLEERYEDISGQELAAKIGQQRFD